MGKILSDVSVCGEVGVVRWYGSGYILWVVELAGWGGEQCFDASAFAEATADKRCLMLDVRKMAKGLKYYRTLQSVVMMDLIRGEVELVWVGRGKLVVVS